MNSTSTDMYVATVSFLGVTLQPPYRDSPFEAIKHFAYKMADCIASSELNFDGKVSFFMTIGTAPPDFLSQFSNGPLVTFGLQVKFFVLLDESESAQLNYLPRGKYNKIFSAVCLMFRNIAGISPDLTLLESEIRKVITL